MSLHPCVKQAVLQSMSMDCGHLRVTVHPYLNIVPILNEVVIRWRHLANAFEQRIGFDYNVDVFALNCSDSEYRVKLKTKTYVELISFGARCIIPVS